VVDHTAHHPQPFLSRGGELVAHVQLLRRGSRGAPKRVGIKPAGCHPERSEGSLQSVFSSPPLNTTAEILRFAQDDTFCSLGPFKAFALCTLCSLL